MKWVKVDSSMLAAVRYDAKAKALDAEFVSGATRVGGARLG